MVDFSAQITMLPLAEGTFRPSAGWAWYCRLRLGQEFRYASLISRSGFFLPERTNVVYVTLFGAEGCFLFEPGSFFDIIDGDLVATGVVEPPERLNSFDEPPRDQTHPVLQAWVCRRPEWFIQTRLELNEHSAGWSDLLEETFATIEKEVPDRGTAMHVAQVKQKLGGLVIYVRHQLSDSASLIISDKLTEVHRRSLTTCEMCGGAGHRGAQKSFICVRCSKCAPEDWSLDRS